MIFYIKIGHQGSKLFIWIQKCELNKLRSMVKHGGDSIRLWGNNCSKILYLFSRLSEELKPCKYLQSCYGWEGSPVAVSLTTNLSKLLTEDCYETQAAQ